MDAWSLLELRECRRAARDPSGVELGRRACFSRRVALSRGIGAPIVLAYR